MGLFHDIGMGESFHQKYLTNMLIFLSFTLYF
jgi:hypothetical protein